MLLGQEAKPSIFEMLVAMINKFGGVATESRVGMAKYERIPNRSSGGGWMAQTGMTAKIEQSRERWVYLWVDGIATESRVQWSANIEQGAMGAARMSSCVHWW